MRAMPFAYNELNLTPAVFWDLNPAEFNDLRDGFYRRRRRETELQATWICVLVNSMPMRGKNAKTLRVEQLIGQAPDMMAKLIRERDERRRKHEEAKALQELEKAMAEAEQKVP